jgi:hypothetical protein
MYFTVRLVADGMFHSPESTGLVAVHPSCCFPQFDAAAGVTDMYGASLIFAIIEALNRLPRSAALTKSGIRNDEALEASPQAFPCD